MLIIFKISQDINDIFKVFKKINQPKDLIGGKPNIRKFCRTPKYSSNDEIMTSTD